MVSVIIPAYNRREFIGETVDSVLAQTYKDLEVIVVDDGSTDGTGEYLKSRYAGESRFRYIWQENAERSAARNAGIMAARGGYVAFIDSDDLWVPEKLEMQMQMLHSNPGMVMAVTWFDYVDNDYRTLQVVESPSMDDVLSGEFAARNAAQNRIGSPTPVIKRQVVLDAGMFCPAINQGEDWDLWTRVSCFGKVGLVAEVLARHRIHPGNTEEHTTVTNYISVVAIMRKRLDKARWEAIQTAALDSYWQRLKHTPPLWLCGRISAIGSGLFVFRRRFICRIMKDPWRETARFVLGPNAIRLVRRVLHPEIPNSRPPGR